MLSFGSRAFLLEGFGRRLCGQDSNVSFALLRVLCVSAGAVGGWREVFGRRSYGQDSTLKLALLRVRCVSAGAVSDGHEDAQGKPPPDHHERSTYWFRRSLAVRSDGHEDGQGKLPPDHHEELALFRVWCVPVGAVEGWRDALGWRLCGQNSALDLALLRVRCVSVG